MKSFLCRSDKCFPNIAVTNIYFLYFIPFERLLSSSFRWKMKFKLCNWSGHSFSLLDGKITSFNFARNSSFSRLLLRVFFMFPDRRTYSLSKKGVAEGANALNANRIVFFKSALYSYSFVGKAFHDFRQYIRTYRN